MRYSNRNEREKIKGNLFKRFQCDSSDAANQEMKIEIHIQFETIIVNEYDISRQASCIAN